MRSFPLCGEQRRNQRLVWDDGNHLDSSFYVHQGQILVTSGFLALAMFLPGSDITRWQATLVAALLLAVNVWSWRRNVTECREWARTHVLRWVEVDDEDDLFL